MVDKVLIWNILCILFLTTFTSFLYANPKASSLISLHSEEVEDVFLSESTPSSLESMLTDTVDEKPNDNGKYDDRIVDKSLEMISHTDLRQKGEANKSLKPQSTLPISRQGYEKPFSVLRKSYVKNKLSQLDTSNGNLKKIGDYLYTLDGSNFITSAKTQDLSGDSRANQGMRLVYFSAENRYMITKGGIIVSFVEGVNKRVFERDYSLEAKYDLPNMAVYHPVSFERINALLADIKSDIRVVSVELDLIDPYVEAQ